MRVLPVAAVTLLFLPPALAQTTDGLIAGKVVDSITGRPLEGAEVGFLNSRINLNGAVRSDANGRYALLFLPPGAYRLRVAAKGYQPLELHELELAVAARLEIEFQLRPLSDVWESGLQRSIFLPRSDAILTFYGPDVDTSRAGSFEADRGVRGALESTISEVIDPSVIRDLPLAGRDVYTMLVAQPGVTADAGTVRGLGLSINGQRPSASNFLLDGIENNNYLVTGPLMPVAPEAVQEYRVSTANFSAEYGRTSGYLANAVTRSGGGKWHGLGYFNLKNDLLFANGFRENWQGLAKPPYQETQTGFHAGGPLWKKNWFVSGAFEHLRSRSRGMAEEVLLPTTEFVNYTPDNGISRGLLERFPPPPVTKGYLPVATLKLAPAISTDRFLTLGRVDRVAGSHREMGRLVVASISRPDFIWTPYPDFVSGLVQRSYGFVFGEVTALGPGMGNEFRLGWASDRIEWGRAHPEVPTLASFDGTVLPGSPAFYGFRNRGRGVELSENFTWSADKHLLKFGGGFLVRRLDGYLTAGRDARYLFADFLDFALDAPLYFSAPLARRSLPVFQAPRFEREYGFSQFHFFAQDTVRLSRRWVLNLGVRWEHFGSPANTGPEKDGFVDLAKGAVIFPVSGDQRLYTMGGAWAPRFGFAFSPRPGGNLVLRGAYGLFYDRPFDNLWQNARNNSLILPNFLALSGNYLEPVAKALPKYQGQAFTADFPTLTMLDRELESGYVQSAFIGIEYGWAQAWSAQVYGIAALGRRLVTTDLVNRRGGTYQPALPVVSYRSSQGLSNYNGLSAAVGYRLRPVHFRGLYTWGHSIDVQSEPLAGEFFDLSFVRAGASTTRGDIAAFTRQGDIRGNRGSSDFDQRHNFVFHSIWELPRFFPDRKLGSFFRNWQLSNLAAFRTGFPYTVFASSTSAFFNNRADLVGVPSMDEPVIGGRRLLNPAAFAEPPSWRPGNTGRNAFRGPGLYNLDVSLSRSFPLGSRGEAGRLQFRADAYNVFNHANLNAPESFLSAPNFGLALYGRTGYSAGFPALVPFRESPRNFQFLLRVEF